MARFHARPVSQGLFMTSLVVCGATALASCASAGANKDASTNTGASTSTGAIPGTAVKTKDDSTLVARVAEMQAETELGRNMAGRILAITRPVGDAELVRYINEVGALVARASEFPERRFRFEVLDDPGVNAFACPGGYVFVTAGALRLAKDESELAAILGHEIAHVGRKHIVAALRGKDFSKDGAPEGKVLEVEARRRPEPPRNDFGAFLSQNLLGPQAAGLSLVQTVDASFGILFSKGLEPALEYEADALGTRFAARAGWDPGALARYFARARGVAGKAGKAGPAQAEKTHPKFVDREKALRDAAGAAGAAGVGAFGKNRFARMTASLATKKGTDP